MATATAAARILGWRPINEEHLDFPIYRVFRLPIFRFGTRQFTAVSVRYFRYKNMIYMEQYSNAKRMPKITVFICIWLAMTFIFTIQLFWLLFWVLLFETYLQNNFAESIKFQAWYNFSRSADLSCVASNEPKTLESFFIFSSLLFAFI